ncbi:MAG: hypothetical protein ACI4E1_03985 [Lachnospira sp.]
MNRIRLQINPKIIILLIVGAVFGNIVHEVVLHFDKSEDITVFPMGTVMILLFTFCYMLYVSAFEDTLKFNTHISMGCTRSEYFMERILETILELVVSIVSAFACYQLEKWKFSKFYADIPVELDLTQFFSWKVIIPVMLMLGAISFTTSALVMKFGVYAMWALWVAFIFVCIGVPRIVESLLQKIDISSIAASIDNFGMIIGLTVIAVSIIMILFDRMLIMKQAVR